MWSIILLFFSNKIPSSFVMRKIGWKLTHELLAFVCQYSLYIFRYSFPLIHCHTSLRERTYEVRRGYGSGEVTYRYRWVLVGIQPMYVLCHYTPHIHTAFAVHIHTMLYTFSARILSIILSVMLSFESPNNSHKSISYGCWPIAVITSERFINGSTIINRRLKRLQRT